MKGSIAGAGGCAQDPRREALRAQPPESPMPVCDPPRERLPKGGRRQEANGDAAT